MLYSDDRPPPTDYRRPTTHCVRLAVAIACSLAWASSATAQGLYWETKISSGGIERMTQNYAAPKMTKVVGGDGRAVIIRTDHDKLISLDTRKRKYQEMSFSDLESSSKMVQKQMDAARAQMERRMKEASPEQRREVSAFTTDIVERRLGRRIETIFEVSARDRLEENRVTRDWPALEHTLTDLARQQRSALVVSAALRARQRIARRLRAEIDEQEAALRRPIEETAARAARLRAAVEGAERSLQDLRFLFDAAEAEVVRGLDRQRADFAQRAMPELRQSLEAWITANSRLRAAGRLRAGAFDEARRLAEQAISRWLAGVEPHVIALHETATRRFVQLANEFVARVMSDAEPIPVEPLDAVDVREYDRPHFYFASLMHLTAGTPATWLMDRFGFRTARERSVSRQVAPYLTHIVDTNSHRVENDFRERARLSRQQLERRIRERLRDALRSAERGLSIANAKQTMAEQEVRGRLEQLAGVRNEVCALDNDDRASAGEVG